ncbi:MAG TPA: EF-P lysine aminoacylase EpmA [Polyangiales bacterium]|nr:EF-P lysine aminoacylase EpmA [Polyangiales bacterium]
MLARSAASSLAALGPETQVRVCGRVVAVAADSFTLQDDTGCLTVASRELQLLGAIVQVSGVWREGQVEAESIELENRGSERFTRADSDWSYLSGKRLANLRKRHAALQAARAFFDAHGLLEIETPAIVPCPGLDVHLDAIEVLGMGGPPRWLHTSPEYQMKRALATTLPGVYQIGKAFRRGERGKLHEPEFTMLEWYRTFEDDERIQRDTEELVAHVAKAVTGSTKLPGISKPVDVAPPWERLSVEAALQRYAGLSLESVVNDEEKFYRVLVEKIEPELGRGRPTFLTHYPARFASLARLAPNDPRFAERFEAYVDGVELCNGFSELIDPVEQRKRLEQDQETREKLGWTVYPIDAKFLAALEDGVPPSGGNALGFDRLVMAIVGASQIDEVLAFPVSRV